MFEASTPSVSLSLFFFPGGGEDKKASRVSAVKRHLPEFMRSPAFTMTPASPAPDSTVQLANPPPVFPY